MVCTSSGPRHTREADTSGWCAWVGRARWQLICGQHPGEARRSPGSDAVEEHESDAVAGPVAGPQGEWRPSLSCSDDVRKGQGLRADEEAGHAVSTGIRPTADLDRGTRLEIEPCSGAVTADVRGEDAEPHRCQLRLNDACARVDEGLRRVAVRRDETEGDTADGGSCQGGRRGRGRLSGGPRCGPHLRSRLLRSLRGNPRLGNPPFALSVEVTLCLGPCGDQGIEIERDDRARGCNVAPLGQRGAQTRVEADSGSLCEDSAGGINRREDRREASVRLLGCARQLSELLGVAGGRGSRSEVLA